MVCKLFCRVESESSHSSLSLSPRLGSGRIRSSLVESLGQSRSGVGLGPGLV